MPRKDVWDVVDSIDRRMRHLELAFIILAVATAPEALARIVALVL